MDQQAIAHTQSKFVHMETRSLLEVIKKNRETHMQEWERAHSIWRELQVERISKYASETFALVESIKSGNDKIEWVNRTPFMLEEPHSYITEYDRVIRRLDLSIDKEMYLSHQDFDKYVMDDWSWKEGFSKAISKY